MSLAGATRGSARRSYSGAGHIWARHVGARRVRTRHIGAREASGAVAVCAVLVAGALLGALTVRDDLIGLALAALMAVAALVAADPLLVPIAAFPAMLLIQRAGSGATGSSLSLSDVVVVLALAVALPKVRWEPAHGLRRALVPALAYEAIMMPVVLANPNLHDALEWGHRLEMVAGALVVGWVVGASGRARQAAVALLVGCMVLAVLTIEHAFLLHFQPAQWGLYQKNYLGAMMWMGAIIAHVNPPWMGVPRRLASAAKYLCVLGLLASQGKQDVIALAAVVVLAAVLDPEVRSRSRLVLALLVPVVIAGYFMLASELARSSQFNTVTVRTTTLTSDLRVWLSSPIFGEGMRWFYLPQFSGYIQPPNILVEILVSSGIVGVLATLVLLVGATRVLLYLPRSVGTVAIVLLAGRVVEAIFDIYWVSPVTTLPWLIAGLALGAWDAGLVGTSLVRRRQREQISQPRIFPELPE